MHHTLYNYVVIRSPFIGFEPHTCHTISNGLLTALTTVTLSLISNYLYDQLNKVGTMSINLTALQTIIILLGVSLISAGSSHRVDVDTRFI